MRNHATYRFIFSRQIYSGRCHYCPHRAEAMTLTEVMDLIEDHVCPQHKKRKRQHRVSLKERSVLEQFYNQIVVDNDDTIQ